MRNPDTRLADLSAVLRRTIDALPSATPQLRAKVYEKARAAVQRQIGQANPPLALEMADARRRALEEAIRDTEDYYAGSLTVPAPEIGTSFYVPPVEQQSDIAVAFVEGPDGHIDVDLAAMADRVSLSQGSRDRHSETQRAAQRFLSSISSEGVGANSAAELFEAVQDLQEALGDNVENVRPGLLIARGERLRSIQAEQLTADDDFSNVAPLTPKLLSAFRVLLAAYNGFVALDPELARQDDAILGPDVIRSITPAEGMGLITSARDADIAAPSAVRTLDEFALTVPTTATLEDRRSRRFTEGVRNFLRAVLGTARTVLIASVSATKKTSAALKFAKWVIANEDAILAAFSGNPIIQGFISEVLEMLKNLPVRGL